ncbi:super-infection exclusion protein B [Agrobacterium sp. 10MFCol1.1]|uniref:super-infection exclusion protein B n=1 Tax=Agrobacterium sp. 10MFCol1.1 TaxID=1150775 RepID=UPI00036B87C9
MPLAFVVVANIGIFFFGALTVVWIVRWLRDVILWLRHEITFSRNVVDQLDSLSVDERRFIRSLLENNQSHYTTSLTSPVTATLIHRGLVRRGSGQHSMIDFPHYVPLKVWKVIKKNGDRL